MASVMSFSNQNQKPLLIEKRPTLMLKDYLRDDLSSCSSNGFKSFPRRQCCTTVRFLLEIDLNSSSKHQNQQRFKRRSSSKAAATTISALQKASEAVINAVKLLPFPSSSTLSPSSRKRVLILPRSLSRRLFKKSFWKKAERRERECSEIRRWKSFREFLEDKEKPSDQNSTTANFTSTSSSSSNCNSKSNSWTDSEFTGNSIYSESYSGRKAAAEGENEKYLPSEKKVSDGVGVTVGEDSTTTTYSVENSKDWPNEEDKEQFSPVSVLDCTFQDEEEIGSPFQRSPHSKKGTNNKQKYMAKTRKLESLEEIEPVNLEKQILIAELEDESIQSPVQVFSFSIHSNTKKINIFKDTKDGESAEKGAKELLEHVKAKIPTSKADSMLLDLFKEKILQSKASFRECKQFEKEIEIAQEWINGQPQEMFLGWEVKDNRAVYIRDMERNGNWRNLNQEKEDLALELELQVYTSLVSEILVDLLS